MTARHLGRLVTACCVLAAACTLASSSPLASNVESVHASGPAITVSPDVNLPNGFETILGSGFDPGAEVDVSVQSSVETSTVDTLLADATGVISASITLPFTLDANLANNVIAQETGSSVSARSAVTGAAVLPTAASGLQISAHPGDTVHVHVYGFAPRDPLTIRVGDLPAVFPAGVQQYVADATGSADLTFSVPGYTQSGPSQIVVSGRAAGAGQNDSASIAVNIGGMVTLVVTPNPALPGQRVEVAAGGFSPGEQVALSFGYIDAVSHGNAVAGATAQADQAGQLDTRFSIPASATSGITDTLNATGSTSGIVLSRGVFIRAQPSITLQPPGGLSGSNIMVTGTGFDPGERVTLRRRRSAHPAEA